LPPARHSQNSKDPHETTKSSLLIDSLPLSIKNFNLEIARQLYEEGLKEKNTFSGLRLGDLHFYGKLDPSNQPNYAEAVRFYEQAVLTNTSRDIMAQSYHSLGYMYQFGLGVERNLTTAIDYYQGAIDMQSRLGKVYYVTKLVANFEEYLGIELRDVLSNENYIGKLMIVGQIGLDVLNRTYLAQPIFWLAVSLYLVLTFKAFLNEKKEQLLSGQGSN